MACILGIIIVPIIHKRITIAENINVENRGPVGLSEAIPIAVGLWLWLWACNNDYWRWQDRWDKMIFWRWNAGRAVGGTVLYCTVLLSPYRYVWAPGPTPHSMSTSLGIVRTLIHSLRWGSMADKPCASRCPCPSIAGLHCVKWLKFHFCALENSHLFAKFLVPIGWIIFLGL